ncbi:hypothetical protein QNH39_18535 [Neobacillus novalis]|uniref:Uncharacterized protein n=1 Tax=Neobacillus novalis TaxID=220687 RepID=A0AA95MP02_9BACI|nr:hypothetical protein [Neobacillus novalis]WHY84636.1 hypothetical protein QNH39_18535 [Neobacillus novalis]
MEKQLVPDFLGTKFIDYIHFKRFKELMKERLNYKNNKPKDFISFYSAYLDDQKNRDINAVLFEHIFYGQLKNITVHKLILTKKPSIKDFKKNTKKLFDFFQSDSIPPNVKRKMSEDGFYVMDSFNVSVKGTKFLAGYDFVEDEDNVKSARFLIGRVVPRKKKDGKIRNEYLLAGVEINFEEKTCLILNRNLTGINFESEEEEDLGHTIKQFHDWVKEKIFFHFSLKTKLDVKQDRKGMYSLCKMLFDQLVSEDRNKIKTMADNEISSMTNRLFKNLDKMGEKSNKKQKSDFIEKIHSLLLGIYVSNNLDDEKLVKKARDLGLIGFPTKISYKNEKANKSSTGTSAAQNPIASSDTLYSLYTDFENAKELQQWSMSWFYKIVDTNDVDVVQTTIYTTTEQFRIIFKARRHLNKEFIYHVVRNLDSHRQY